MIYGSERHRQEGGAPQYSYREEWGRIEAMGQ